MESTLLASFILFGSFFVMLFLGLPVAVSIALSSLLTIMSVFSYDMATFALAQKMFSGIDSFTLLAIPLFILSGQIMNKGGIALRLIRLATLLGGKLPGSLFQANILGNMLFGSIASSSVASAAAIGGVMAPLQKKEGYDPALSAAVNISSAPIGLILPPAGTLIIFSLMSGGTSIAALFMAGYLPGFLMGLLLMITSAFLAYKAGYKGNSSASLTGKTKIVLDAIPPLFLIVVVIGGIIGGVFTATEGAAVAVLYTLILAFIYREMKLSDILPLFGQSLKSSAIILFLIATSGMMGYAMVLTGIPEAISNAVLGVSDNRYVVFFVMNIALLLVSTFLDITPCILLFTPIFFPIAQKFGMDPVHFGIMLTFNMAIGNMTPPVGTVLFVGCQVGGVTIEKTVVKLLPLLATLFVGLMMITYIPAISLILPKMMGLI